ncbi:MAG: NAD-dependent epimerase/dehydratase family protein [bacterium]|nr:NAD-dependent epimerase/dehydratase family protein [bacterium]
MPFREIRTSFVTGGTGFVGSHLVDHLLQRGSEVRCLVRDRSRLRWLQGKPVTLVEGDLDSEAIIRDAASGTDAFFHLAGATAAASREQYFRVNAEGSRKAARAALEAAEPPGVFIYVSSMAAVGPGLSGEVVAETRRPLPVTDYGRSKLDGERILSGMGPLPLVTLRPPTVYGPRDREVLPMFRLASKGFLPLLNPEASLSLVHVEDLVRGIVAAAQHSRIGETYFITHPEPIATVDLPGYFSDALGRRVRGLRVPGGVLAAAASVSEGWGRLTGRMPVFNRQKVRELTAASWVCSYEKAREQIDFTAGIAIADGVARTARWYEEQGWL